MIKYVNAASISEVLPNTENDALLEYISLKNVSCVSEDISGYTLSDASGKVFVLPTNSLLGPGSLLSYYRSETKISLNNEDESLFLRDSTGQLVDTFSYVTSVK